MLAETPGVRVAVGNRQADLTLPRADEAKIFVWQRPILRYPNDLARLQGLIRRGYLIVVEYDDDPLRRPEHEANRYLTLKGCHGLQTSTIPLAQRLRPFQPEIAVFPNQITELPPPRRRAPRETVTIFFGALNRQHDWAPIMPALNEVLRTCPDKVHFRVVWDRAFFDALECPHKQFDPWCEPEKYHAILADCDLGLLPLEPTTMNQMKSDLKFIEHASHGVPVLASPVVYDQVIVDGESGLLYSSTEHFKKQLLQLIHDAPLRARLGDRAYAYVREHRQLRAHVAKRLLWYRSLLARRDSLTRSLRERVPELFASQ